MPTTIDQRLQRLLMRLAESPETNNAEKLKLAGYLIEIRQGKQPKSKPAKTETGPSLAHLLGTPKQPKT